MRGEGIRRQIENYRRRFHGLELARGSILFIGGLVVSTFVFVLIEYFSYLSIVAKTLLFTLWLLSNGALLFLYVLRPILAMWMGYRAISDREIAVRVGQDNGAVEDKLINYLELESSRVVSPDYLKTLLEQKNAELKQENLLQSLDFRILKRVTIFTSIPLSMVLITAAFNGGLVTEGSERFFDYQTAYQPKAPFEFVSDQGWLVRQGEPLQIDLSFSGDKLPSDAFIWIDDEKLPMQRNASGAFHWKITRLSKAANIQFEAMGFRSGNYKADVLAVPALNSFVMDVMPPAYTGIAPFRTEGAGDGIVPEGSKVSWSTGWENVDSVIIDDTEGYTIATKAASSWLADEVVRKNKQYRIEGRNLNGTVFRTGEYSIDIIPDRHPVIQGDWRLDSVTGTVYASGQVSDDYGIRSIQLNVYKEEGLRARQVITRDANSWSTVFEPLEGDISFEVEVRDNDGINGSKSSRFGPFKLVVPSASDRAEALSERDRDRVEDIREFREKQEESKQLRETLEQRLVEGANEWRQNQMKRQLQEQQQELMERWNEMVESLKQQNEERIVNDPENSENAEKREELERLLEEMDTDKLEELIKEMEEDGEDMNEDNLRDWMKRVQYENERMQMDAERMEELMKRLNFEQNVDQALQELEQMQQEQQDLSERSDDTQSEQEELNERFEDWMNNLDALEQENQELKSPMSFDSPKEQGEETSESMQESSDELQEGDPSGANEQQERSSESMQKMMEQMSSSVMSMQMEMHVENLANLRRILTNLVHLSVDQEALLSNDMGEQPSDPVVVDWMKRQQDLRKAYEIVEDSLSTLIERVPQVEATVTEWMIMVKQNMERSNATMSERQMPQANSSMRESMLALNELALMMDVTMDQIQQQMSGMMQGDQTCQNPGGSKPSMSNMRKMQQQLSQQMQQMGQQPGSGEGEGQSEGESEGESEGKNGQSGEGGQGSDGGMSREIVEMMSRQNEIREMLKGSAGENGNGDLEELLKENERDLANRNFDSDFWERQREIEVKMLELEEAERLQEQDDQRESQTGDRYQELREQYQEEFLRKARERREEIRYETPLLTPYYRERTSPYLRRL